MVEPMSPRLASISTSAPASRSLATARSSTAMPAEPNRSKNADCGLKIATESASASTTPIVNDSSPAGSSDRPQVDSRWACGSMPTHSGPRSSIAARSRAPKGLSWVMGDLTLCRSSRARPPSPSCASRCEPGVGTTHQSGAAVDQPGVELYQTRAGVEHPARVVRIEDAADADHRELSGGLFVHVLDNPQGPFGQRPAGQAARLRGARLVGGGDAV